VADKFTHNFTTSLLYNSLPYYTTANHLQHTVAAHFAKILLLQCKFAKAPVFGMTWVKPAVLVCRSETAV
jgi:hypothetical protein